MLPARITALLAIATESVQCGDKAGYFSDEAVAFVCEDGEFTSPSTWVAPPTYAFEASNFSCQIDPVSPSFQINSSSFYPSRLVSSVGESTDYDVDVLSALSLAAVKWNTLPVLRDGACVELQVSPTGASDDFEKDATSTVVYERGYNFLDSSAVMANTLYYDTARPEDGAVSCDIMVYEKAYVKSRGVIGGVHVTPGLKYLVWDTDDNPANNPTTTSDDTFTAMMPTCFAHELGHCLGLNEQLETDGLLDSIMYNSVAIYQSVDPADIDEAATAFLYCNS